jgi:hypothetical protein
MTMRPPWLLRRLPRWKRIHTTAKAGLRAFAAAIVAIASDTDTYVFGGLALAAAGVALIYLPAGIIVAGVGLFGLGVWLTSPGSPGAAGGADSEKER